MKILHYLYPWHTRGLSADPTPSSFPRSYWMPPYSILQISKNCYFLSPPTQSHCWRNIYWWFLRQMYFENISMYAQYCPKLTDYKPCDYGVVCPTTTPSPILLHSKYNTMDRQWCSNERPRLLFMAYEGSFKASFTWKVTPKAVKVLGFFLWVFSCDIIEGPHCKYLIQSLDQFQKVSN